MASITGGSAILEKHREAIERDGPRMVTQAVGKNTFYGGSVKPDRDDKQSSSPNSYFQTGYKSLMDLAIRRILVVVATPSLLSDRIMPRRAGRGSRCLDESATPFKLEIVR